MNQKGIAPILIIALVAVVIIAGLSLTYVKYVKPGENENENTNQAVMNENSNQNANSNENQNTNTNANVNTNTNVDANANANVNASVNTNITVDETAGWKTYTSSEYYFSFKYPTDWVVTEGSTNTPYKIDVYPKANGGGWTPGSIVFWVDRAYSPQQEAITTTSTVTYSGMTAQQKISKYKETGKEYFWNLKFTPQPSGWGNDAEVHVFATNDESYIIQDKILKTLSFAKPTTYTSKLGFSVEIPSDWNGYKITDQADSVNITHPKTDTVSFAVTKSTMARIVGMVQVGFWENYNFFFAASNGAVASGYQSAWDEIPNIQKTFKVTDQTEKLPWAKFTNSAYQYQIRYPNSSYNISRQPNDESRIMFRTDIEKQDMHVEANILTSADGILFSWVKNGFSGEKPEGYLGNPFQEKSKRDLNGTTFTSFTYAANDTTDKRQVKVYYYYIPKDDIVMQIYDIRPENITDKTNDKIVSTFRFTGEGADWKTYNNADYNFSAKYPLNLIATEVKQTNLSQVLAYVVFDTKTFIPKETEIFVPILVQVRSKDPEDFGIDNGITNTVTISGVKGYDITFTDKMTQKEAEVIILEKNGKFFVLRCMDTKNYGQIFDQMVSAFKFTDENSQSLTIDERPVIINYPLSYKLEKNTEENRRGSVITYNITPRGSSPSLQELQIFSRESIQAFNTKCQAIDYPCFFGDYPTVERFDGLYNAFSASNNYQDYKLITLGQQKYLVKDIKSVGDIGYLREYNTFVGTTMVTLWVNISDSSMDGQADALIVTWKFIYNGL